MKSIYIVQGFKGEYDDYDVWPVCAYELEDEAEKHRDALNDWARENKLHSDFRFKENNFTQYPPPVCPYDSRFFGASYTGVEWHYYELAMKEKFEL